LDYRDRYQRLTGVSLRDWPHCGRGQMVRIESLRPGTLPRGHRRLPHERKTGHHPQRFSIHVAKR